MLDRELHGDVAEIRMNRPPANALTTEFVAALRSALNDTVRDGARAVMLTGREGLFSAGLDVPALIDCDRREIRRFWSEFMLLNRELADCAVPVVAVIGGHSPAGGAVLAVHCDYRIAVDGPFKIGFNEVRVGLPVPSSILETVGELVGRRVARRITTAGLLLDMTQACDIGLVDELAPPGNLSERALAWAGELIALPPLAMNATRRAAKSRLLAALDTDRDIDAATEAWFSDETRAGLRALVDSLRK